MIATPSLTRGENVRQGQQKVLLLALALSVGLLPVAVNPARAGERDAPAIVIKAGRVHTAVGDPIDNGMIIIRGGEVVAVGQELSVPDDARVIEQPKAVLTPGLIDACCVLNSEVRQAASSRAQPTKKYTFWEAVASMYPEDPDAPSAPAREPFCSDEGEVPLGPAGAVERLAPSRPVDVSWAEQSSEVTPHRLVIDSVDLLSSDFMQLLKGGVTTVYVSPDSANVIGARGAVVKTGGPLDERVVERASAVKVSLGEDPCYRGRRNSLPPYYGPAPTFHTRRPTTRMGVEFVFRKALYDAKRVQHGVEPYGADTPPTEALPVLQRLLDGDVPLRVHARMQHDIFTALRLAGEFGLKFVLEEATEAYRCLPELKAAGVPVVFGPLYMSPHGYRAQTSEADRPRLNSPQQLAGSGIRFALTAQELRGEEGLMQQGMFAVRNGLSAEAALRAMTATPAELLGLGGRVGALAPGARADLVVWSGEPFDATSRPLMVLIDGQVVYNAKD